MDTRIRRCGHCGTDNAVAACRTCGRYFVVTQSHLEGQPRSFESKPLSQQVEFDVCDFCASKAAGLPSPDVIQAGLRQQTCAHCHTEFLSGDGLWQQRAPRG